MRPFLSQAQFTRPARMNIFTPMGGNVPYGAMPIPWGAPGDEDILKMRQLGGVYPVPHGGFPIPWGPQTEEEARRTYLGGEEVPPEFMGRVEVRSEATDNFIKGAKVTVMYRDTPIMTKLTDMGGNAVFSVEELAEKMPATAEKEDVYYRVEAEGYEPGEAAFVGDQITEIRLLTAPGEAKSEGPLGIPLWGWAAGGAAVVGLLVVTLVRK